MLLAPVVKPGNAGLDFFQQLVIGGNLPVDVAFLGGNAPALHLAGGRPHVNGWNFVNALPLVAAVVDALRPASGLQRPVGISGPRRPPLLGVPSLVPVGGVLPMVLPAAFAIRDALALAVQIVHLAALRAPLAIFFYGPDCQHDMGVGIAGSLIVDGEVGAHSSVNKIVFDERADKRQLLRPG